jgi:hypothetical protein
MDEQGWLLQGNMAGRYTNMVQRWMTQMSNVGCEEVILQEVIPCLTSEVYGVKRKILNFFIVPFIRTIEKNCCTFSSSYDPKYIVHPSTVKLNLIFRRHR